MQGHAFHAVREIPQPTFPTLTGMAIAGLPAYYRAPACAPRSTRGPHLLRPDTPVLPTRRDLHFKLDATRLRNWHAAGPWVTHFANAMSLSFPAGERFFIHTVRHYRDRIVDPDLQEAVTAFIGQEAMHSREHEDYNRLLGQLGLPVAQLEAELDTMAEWIKRWLPASAQLSVTIAQEHFTAIFSGLVLRDPRLLAGADERLLALWRWHALEEIEHKAVAFDVYETAVGRGISAYVLRTGSMLLTTAGFLALAITFQQRLLAAEAGPDRWRGLGRFARFMFSSPALLPRLALPWLRYFEPGFHPWHQDDLDLLAQMDGVVAPYASAPTPRPPRRSSRSRTRPASTRKTVSAARRAASAAA